MRSIWKFERLIAADDASIGHVSRYIKQGERASFGGVRRRPESVGGSRKSRGVVVGGARAQVEDCARQGANPCRKNHSFGYVEPLPVIRPTSPSIRWAVPNLHPMLAELLGMCYILADTCHMEHLRMKRG